MWTFKTIPEPGEFGYETWPPDAWKTAGGANSWAGMSLDESRGIVYVPTGSASFDFWEGNRKGANLFANCILALNAGTGERIWHYQTVHHDLWDRDLPAPPNLLTVIHNGKKTDAVAQITKSGFVFILERETCEPLFPIEERAVPGSDLGDEETWPTQPFPEAPPPFVPPTFTENEITNISAESHDYVAGILASVRTGELFMPPSTQGTIIFPGFDGGGEWGGAAVDPEKGVLYVNGNIMPWILQMVEIMGDNSAKKGEGESIYQINCAVCHGTDRQGDPTGIIFIGASKDEYFMAFDKDTGKELWKYKLPAGGYAMPSVYEAGGKQYIVIACGGGKMGTKSGNQYVAFTLP